MVETAVEGEARATTTTSKTETRGVPSSGFRTSTQCKHAKQTAASPTPEKCKAAASDKIKVLTNRKNSDEWEKCDAAPRSPDKNGSKDSKGKEKAREIVLRFDKPRKRKRRAPEHVVSHTGGASPVQKRRPVVLAHPLLTQPEPRKDAVLVSKGRILNENQTEHAANHQFWQLIRQHSAEYYALRSYVVSSVSRGLIVLRFAHQCSTISAPILFSIPLPKATTGRSGS